MILRPLALAALLLAAAAASADAPTLRIVDDAGHEVALSHPARRIVALAPHLTELVYAAGALLAGPLRRFEQSLPISELALRLAEEAGLKDIAANATGNLALALLNLRRAEEAAEMFEHDRGGSVTSGTSPQPRSCG